MTPVLLLTFAVPSLKAEGGTGASILHKSLPIHLNAVDGTIAAGAAATWYSGGSAKHG